MTEIFEIKMLLSPVSSPCYNFKRDSTGLPEKRTVYIAPIRFNRGDDGSLNVAYACSSGPCCFDYYCRYSHKREG